MHLGLLTYTVGSGRIKPAISQKRLKIELWSYYKRHEYNSTRAFDCRQNVWPWMTSERDSRSLIHWSYLYKHYMWTTRCTASQVKLHLTQLLECFLAHVAGKAQIPLRRLPRNFPVAGLSRTSRGSRHSGRAGRWKVAGRGAVSVHVTAHLVTARRLPHKLQVWHGRVLWSAGGMDRGHAVARCGVHRGGFNGRPLVQWPTGPLALEAPGRVSGSWIEFMIYLLNRS